MQLKFHTYKFKVYLIILFLTGSFFSIDIYSEEKISIDERPFLPIWCNHVQGFESDPRTIQFMNQIGEENWIHLHHYCYGLVQIFRSHRIGISLSERYSHLARAVDEISYVLRFASPTFAWRPELLTKRGLALLFMKKHHEASDDFKTAIKENANYWPPYGYLADLYLEQGKVDKAKSILKTGLEINPNAKGLKNRIATLEKNQ